MPKRSDLDAGEVSVCRGSGWGRQCRDGISCAYVIHIKCHLPLTTALEVGVIVSILYYMPQITTLIRGRFGV